MSERTYTNGLLPVELPFRKAMSIYAKRFWIFFAVTGFLLFVYPLFAWLLVKYHWPLNLFAKITIVAASILCVIGIVNATRYVILHHRVSWQMIVMLITIGLGGPITQFYLLDQFLPNFIAMDCPDKVTGTTTLQGRIIDPRWQIYLILRPRLGDAFIQEVPPAGKDGTWYATCAFGGGSGTVFEISALALSPDSVRVLDFRLVQRPEAYLERLEALASYKTSICVVTKE